LPGLSSEIGFCLAGTTENSPAIHCWGLSSEIGFCLAGTTENSPAIDWHLHGLWLRKDYGNEALNHIFQRIEKGIHRGSAEDKEYKNE